MMTRSCNIFLMLCVMAAFLFSCKPTIPRKYVQPGTMEDILYDYYVAIGMVETEETDPKEAAYNQKLYRLSVLGKYGVSEADFDSSMVYYTRHADRLHDIYENVAERLEKEAMALGASANDVNRFGAQIATGDTADIWRGERHAVLMPTAPYNVISYNAVADTSFHKGDRIIWSFNTQFIYQEGYKDGIAMLALRFTNDSVTSRIIHTSSNSRYSLELADNDKLGIKEVRGFIYLSREQNAPTTTLKLMFVDNIRLVKFHEKKGKDEEDKPKTTGPEVKNPKADSIKPEKITADSIKLATPPKATKLGNRPNGLHQHGGGMPPKPVPIKERQVRP